MSAGRARSPWRWSSVAGGFTGSWLLLRAPEKLLRGAIILIGTALTLWLFLR